MTDEQIAKIYAEGNAVSHANGLRAVYEAGRKHDERVAQAQENARIAALEKELIQEDNARLAALEKGQVLIEEPKG